LLAGTAKIMQNQPDFIGKIRPLASTHLHGPYFRIFGAIDINLKKDNILL
jgi:hypothetical protein